MNCTTSKLDDPIYDTIRLPNCQSLKQTNKQTKTTYEIRNNKSRKYGLLFLLAGYITLSHIFTCSLTTHPEKTTQNIGKHSRKNTSARKVIHIKKKLSKLNTFYADSWPEIYS